MRMRSAVAKVGKTRDTPREILAEGLSEGSHKTFMLCGKQYTVPMRKKNMRWTEMTSEALVDFTKAYCKENEITKRSELAEGPKSLGALYWILKQKELNGIKLLGIVFPRKEFEDMKLGDNTFEIPLDKKGDRNWSAMSPEALLDFTKAYCKENDITKRSELAKSPKALHGLRIILEKKELGGKKLIDIVFPREKFEEITLDGETFHIPLNTQGDRNWSVMSPEELVEFTKAYCKTRDITKIGTLMKNLPGLYNILLKKSLTDKVFERKKYEEMVLDGKVFMVPLDSHENRNWAAMTDDKIVGFAKAYCKEKGITKRNELRTGSKSPGGLYKVLRQKKLGDKKLIDIVFSEIEQSRDAAVLSALKDALETFGGSSK